MPLHSAICECSSFEKMLKSRANSSLLRTDVHSSHYNYVSQLSQATGQHPTTIYSALYTAFNVPRYQELLEAKWEQVERWFQSQLERKR
jgi:hypothetical protein